MGRHLELWFHTYAMLQSFENFLLFLLCHTTVFFRGFNPKGNDLSRWQTQGLKQPRHNLVLPLRAEISVFNLFPRKWNFAKTTISSHTFLSSRHISLHPDMFFTISKPSRVLYRNPHLTQDKSSPCLFAPTFPFFCKCSTWRPRFHPLLCKLHNFSQWNVHQAYRNKTLQ